MTERATLPRPAREAAQHISALRDITPEQFERYGKELPQVLQ
jgi:hypothetical protein